MKKIKKIFCTIVAFFLVGTNIGGTISVFADGEAADVKNPDEITISGGTAIDGVVISKSAEKLEGYLNEYKIGLKIESPVVTETSDTVIVLDRSNTMGATAFSSAKSAADSIAASLLGGDNAQTGLNRVAVVSFTNTATNTVGTFTNNYNTVHSAIDVLNVSGSRGGFVQAALHNAAILLNSSNATHKNIVLLSDGVTTYSYRMNNLTQNNFTSVNNRYQTNQTVPSTAFRYTGNNNNNNNRTGNGNSTTTAFVRYGQNADTCPYDSGYGYNSVCDYNHANSTIAEAGFLNGNASLYILEYGTDEAGLATLASMATAAGGTAYTSTAANITTIEEAVAGSLVPLADGVTVTDSLDYSAPTVRTRATGHNWTPEFTLDNGVFVAEDEYTVAVNSDFLNQVPDANGFYALTAGTRLMLGDVEIAAFPEPLVKPVTLTVKKEVVADDEVVDGLLFRFTVSGNDNEYTVESGSSTTVVMPFTVGESYTVTEEDWVEDDSEIKFENYTQRYSNGTFVVAEDDENITVKITNVYKSTSVEATIEWDDDDDRDGIRDDYEDMYVAVKDGDTFVGYQANAVDGKYTIADLPKYRNGEEIEYEVVEVTECTTDADGTISCTEFEDDGVYAPEVEDTVITNIHEPETVEILIKKTWTGNDEAHLPESILVNVAGGDFDDNVTITKDDSIEGECTEWCLKVTGLYKYDQGEEIAYTVRESNMFWAAGDGFIEYGVDMTDDGEESVEGRYDVAEEVDEDGAWTVTNTWTSADFIYSGATDFKIKKLSEDGQPMSGVTFSINGEEMITDEDGIIVVEIPESLITKSEVREYEIYEIDTYEGYDLDTDIANLKVEIESNLIGVDTTELINNYAKKFTFTASGNENYVWNQEERMFVLNNKRSRAEALIIEEEFSGIDAEDLKGSDLTFFVYGPEDFETLAISISEFAFEDGKATMTILNLPTGEYIVEKVGGEVEGYTMDIEGETEISREMEKDDTKKVTFVNVYTKDEEPEDVPEVPETGSFTKNEVVTGVEANTINYVIGFSALILLGLPIVFSRKKKVELTK